jgi:cytochrome bd-type quinol oxidase subunit 1
MNDFFCARSQMGMSLAFQIVFAVIGLAMPLLMAVSEGKRALYCVHVSCPRHSKRRSA